MDIGGIYCGRDSLRSNYSSPRHSMLCAQPRLKDVSLAELGPKQTTHPPPSFVGLTPRPCCHWGFALSKVATAYDGFSTFILLGVARGLIGRMVQLCNRAQRTHDTDMCTRPRFGCSCHSSRHSCIWPHWLGWPYSSTAGLSYRCPHARTHICVVALRPMPIASPSLP